MAKANLAPKIRKTNLELNFINNLDLTKKGYTVFLLMNLAKKDFNKFLDLAILVQDFALPILLLPPILSTVLSSPIGTRFFAKSSTSLILSREVSRVVIWLKL